MGVLKHFAGVVSEPIIAVHSSKCQRQILDIQWWQHISNADVLQRSGLPLISDILLHRRQSLFGHIARLDPSVPANAALQHMVNSHEGKKPSTI